MNKKTKADQESYVYLPLMTISETAKYMGIGRKMVYELIEWGELRVVRARRTKLVEKASVDRFINSGKRI